MLDRLKGADSPAELLAHLGVFDRHLQGRPTDADRLRRRQNPKHRPRLARGAAQYTVLLHRDAAQCDRPDAASGVHRLQRSHGDPVGVGVDDHHVLTRGDHQYVGVGSPKDRRALASDNEIGTDRHVARQRKCADCGSVGQARKHLCANRIRRTPVNHHRRGHARQEGAGAQLAALRLEHHGEFGKTEARTAVLLGDGQADPPERSGRRPDVGRAGGSLLERRAGRRAAVQPVKLPDHGLGQVLVFLRDG